MKILIDTNVVLDVLLSRDPHAGSAAAVLGAIDAGLVEGLVGATTVTTLHYLLSKSLGPTKARQALETLLSLCDVAPVDESVIRGALSLRFRDFEDAVLHESGRRAGARGVVTRDRDGFRKSQLPVYTPEELIATLRAAR